MQIGITERGDSALDIGWLNWIKDDKPAILITKDPETLHSRLHGYNVEDANIIVHCGITGRGGTVVEPNIPPMENALEGYKELVRALGIDRVVLRLDPVFPNDKGFERTAKVVRQHEDTRIRLAFLHAYPHVKQRFIDARLTPPPYNFYAPLEKRKEIHKKLEDLAGRKIEVCGEPGFRCTGCISITDIRVFELLDKATTKLGRQRKHCACLAMKKELLSGKKQCRHKCLYCYWK
jgi:DNA repair photolyase